MGVCVCVCGGGGGVLKVGVSSKIKWCNNEIPRIVLGVILLECILFI